MKVVGSGIFEFEQFRLNRRGGGLFRADKNGTFVPVAIGSRALDVLCVLVQRHGDLVSKDEIMAAVWPGIVVADSNLPIQILALRRVLDHGRSGGSCIQTVAGRGYRFVAPVTEAQCKYADTTEAVEPPTASAGRDVLVERRLLTVVAGSITGIVSSATESDPEELLETMAALYRACADTLKRYDGFVANLPGDTFLAYFGYPAAREDDAERAVRAGLNLVDIMGRFDAPSRLQTRIGIASGLVIIGDVIGEGDGARPNVVGAAPSLAIRLQALAEPNTVLIAESTQRQIGAFFALEDAGSQLPGDPSRRAWRVLGERRGLGRFEALRSTDTPLVGREEEMALLDRLWTRARSGDGHAVLVSGEPGVGKSRLAAALEERLGEDPHHRLQYFCSPYHQNSALYPIIAQLERSAGFERDDIPEFKLEKLEELLAALLPIDEDIALLADLLSLGGSPRYPRLDFTPQRKKEKTFAAWLRQIEGLSRQRPVLIMFEDLQWADPTSRELLDLIIERLESWPVLLIATFRSEFRPPWTGQPAVTAISLNRLNRRNSAMLVQGLIGAGARLPNDVADAIVKRCDGVPLFLEELTKVILEEAVKATGGPVSAPPSLHALLLARLEQLGPDAKEVAQIGAVIGRQFSLELMASSTAKNRTKLEAGIAALVEAGLVFQRGALQQAGFLFKHALVQEAAYGTLLRAQRQLLHGQIADALLAAGVAAAPEIIAHHLERGDRSLEAVSYWRHAGERAVRRAANREAIEHFRHALSLLEAWPETGERLHAELPILSQLGPALMSVYGWAAPEAEEIVERGARIGRGLESSENLAPSIANLAVLNIYRGRLDQVEEAADDLFRIARELDDTDVMLQAHHCIWPVRWHRGQLALALEHADGALVLYDEERHASHRHLYFGHDPAVCALALGAAAQCLLGHPARAMHRHGEAITLARRLRDPPSLAHSIFLSCASSQAPGGNAVAVFAAATELRELSEQLGFSQFQACAQMFLGWALARSCEAVQGIAQMNED